MAKKIKRIEQAFGLLANKGRFRKLKKNIGSLKKERAAAKKSEDDLEALRKRVVARKEGKKGISEVGQTGGGTIKDFKKLMKRKSSRLTKSERKKYYYRDPEQRLSSKEKKARAKTKKKKGY